jgi:outer membrane protein assembly factor BamD (BamD/ComL family)
MRAENAEAVAREAERRMAEAEENLKIEKEGARMVDVYRQMQREEENVQEIMLNNYEQHMPPGRSSNNTLVHQGKQAHPSSPGRTRAEKDRTSVRIPGFPG